MTAPHEPLRPLPVNVSGWALRRAVNDVSTI